MRPSEVLSHGERCSIRPLRLVLYLKGHIWSALTSGNRSLRALTSAEHGLKGRGSPTQKRYPQRLLAYLTVMDPSRLAVGCLSPSIDLMKPREMPDADCQNIFVSHTASDGHRVEDLLETLGQISQNVWSLRMLRRDQPWWPTVVEHLRTCDIVVFALSPAALGSSGCMEELEYGRILGKPILAVVVASFERALLANHLATIPTVDYTARTSPARYQLKDAVSRLVKAPGV